MLVSNLWGGQGEKLAGDLEMHGKLGSSVNAFCKADILAGLSRVHMRILVAAVALAIEERVHKNCSAAAAIALMKDAISISQKIPTYR